MDLDHLVEVGVHLVLRLDALLLGLGGGTDKDVSDELANRVGKGNG